MKKMSPFLVLLLVFSSCAGFQGNRVPTSGEDPSKFEEEQESSNKRFPSYFINKDYVMDVAIFEGSLDPNDDEEIAPDGLQIELKRGTPFRITQEVVDPVGTYYLRIELGGNLFEKDLAFWVEKEEFAKIFASGERLVFNYLDPLDQVASLGDVLEFQPYRAAGVNFVPPIKARISSKPGMRRHPILKKRKFHAGWDYAAPKGTPVKAAAKGKVNFAGNAGAYGKLIKITHGEGYETRYAHLSKILVKAGQEVSAGQHIGNVGSTGRSTGPHLHFEKRLNGKPLTQ